MEIVIVCVALAATWLDELPLLPPHPAAAARSTADETAASGALRRLAAGVVSWPCCLWRIWPPPLVAIPPYACADGAHPGFSAGPGGTTPREPPGLTPGPPKVLRLLSGHFGLSILFTNTQLRNCNFQESMILRLLKRSANTAERE